MMLLNQYVLSAPGGEQLVGQLGADALLTGSLEDERTHRRELDPHARVVVVQGDLIVRGPPRRGPRDDLTQVVQGVPAQDSLLDGPQQLRLPVHLDLLLQVRHDEVGAQNRLVVDLRSARRLIGADDGLDVRSGLEPAAVEHGRAGVGGGHHHV